MKYLLLGGSHNTGKSTSIWRLAQSLLRSGFIVIDGSVPTIFHDFRAILEGLDKNGKKIIILINSATDEPPIILDLRNYFDSLAYTIDIFISSVRDPDCRVRKVFFNMFPINPTVDFLLEIPLGRILSQRSDYHIALAWYQNTIDSLVMHTLNSTPFDL